MNEDYEAETDIYSLPDLQQQQVHKPAKNGKCTKCTEREVHVNTELSTCEYFCLHLRFNRG